MTISDTDSSDKPELEMEIDLNVLQHLGLKMYTSLPSVISEYVANAWDAWAIDVDIQIPNEPMSDDYEIIIEDNGFGMTPDEANDKFLVVGRNRRQNNGTDEVQFNGESRKVMGRKGIGKLAGFGVASVVNVWTYKNGEFVEFEMDFDEMQERTDDDPTVKTDYSPEIINYGELNSNEGSGTIVTLKELKREQKPNPDYTRQRLARRFAVIGDDFNITINGDLIDPAERNIKDRCQFLKQYDDEPIDEDGECRISGWIGTLKNQVPNNIGSGVIVLARGKLVQEPYTFGVGEGGSTAQQALQYLVGEINAEFLDTNETDLIATDRTKVVWEKPPAANLHEFMQNEISSFAATWPSKRREEKMEDVRETEPYQKYINPLDKWEKNLADSFLGRLSEGQGYDEEILEEMASYVSSGVQQKSFSHLLREIEESDVTDTQQLMELFDKYEVLDALNSLRVVKGRLQAIQKFDDLIESNAKEVPTLHNFIGDNPWLLDPQWDYLDDEVTFRQMLEDQFPDEEFNEDNRRIDFVCLGDVNTLKIVEIKRPEVTIGFNELRQLVDYVDFARELHGSGPVGHREVEGYIIGKQLADSRKARNEYKRIKDDGMYIRTFTDMRRMAKQSHQEFLDVFERKAERTGSDMLRSHLEDFPESDYDVDGDTAVATE
ncbi:ATP-binding protein [Natrialbaceae archaeon A-chndr2]